MFLTAPLINWKNVAAIWLTANRSRYCSKNLKATSTVRIFILNCKSNKNG
jgi:hypothetical protein